MPPGLPSSEALIGRQIVAFTIDTSIFQGAAFRFDDGQLRQLADQLPPWLKLWLPDIVEREIKKHRMEAFLRAVHQVESGLVDIGRYLADTNIVNSPKMGDLINTAMRHFDRQLHGFLTAHSGEILSLHGTAIADALFDRYFVQHAPFGGGKDKKHEFPDAAALLLLEERAREKGIQVIAVSADDGWRRFANSSDVIYCVGSLPALAKLFETRTPELLIFKEKVSAYLQTTGVQIELRNLLNSKLIALPWVFRVPASGSIEIESQLSKILLRDFAIQVESLRLWKTPTNQSRCVAEAPVDIEVDLEIEIVAFEDSHRFPDAREIARVSVIREHIFEVTIALDFEGALHKFDSETIVKKLTLVEHPIRVELEKIQFPGLAPHTNTLGFDDLEDDIPF